MVRACILLLDGHVSSRKTLGSPWFRKRTCKKIQVAADKSTLYGLWDTAFTNLTKKVRKPLYWPLHSESSPFFGTRSHRLMEDYPILMGLANCRGFATLSASVLRWGGFYKSGSLGFSIGRVRGVTHARAAIDLSG